MCLSLEDIKASAEILRNIAEVTALVVGGIWTYLRFIKKRDPYPKAEIKHSISHVRLSSEKNLIHVITNFNNKGEVLLSMVTFDTRLQRITPLTEEMEHILEANGNLIPKGTSEVEWPLLDCHERRWQKGEAELEPGESEYLHGDFIIDSSIEIVVAYSYIKNIYKKEREIGWGCTTIYNIQKGVQIEGGKNGSGKKGKAKADGKETIAPKT